MALKQREQPVLLMVLIFVLHVPVNTRWMATFVLPDKHAATLRVVFRVHRRLSRTMLARAPARCATFLLTLVILPRIVASTTSVTTVLGIHARKPKKYRALQVQHLAVFV